MPRDLLHQLSGADHSKRPGRRDVERKRRLLGLADTGARVFRTLDMLEQLGHNEGCVQQETRAGRATLMCVPLFVGANKPAIS